MKAIARVLAVGMILLAFSAFGVPLLDVHLPDRSSVDALKKGNFDIVTLDTQHAQIIGWPSDVERLGSLGLAYSVIHEDLSAFYRSRLDYELDDMGGYPTFDEIGEWVEEFVADYPDIVSGPDTVGYSLEGRPLWVIKISDNPGEDEDEPELFINATIHAREVIVPLVTMNFAELLAENYGTDQRITDIVNEREIWIMPVVNPDGYTYNELIAPDGGGLWRKNKRRIDGVLYGVDLNRNWPYMWGFDDEGSSPDPDRETYRGESPASEPETQAVIDFINQHEFVSCINYHSYSNLILYPFGYEPEAYSPYDTIYQAFSAAMNETLGWITGRGQDILYSVNGDASDWMEGGADYHLFAFIFEVGGDDDGFWPPTGRIDTLVEQQEEPLLTFCEAGAYPFLFGLPPVPEMVAMDSLESGEFAVTDTVSGEFSLAWQTAEDTLGNDAVAYDVKQLSDPIFEDGADGDFSPWDFNGFLITSDNYYSAPHSYYSDAGPNMFQTLTAEYPLYVSDEDTLRFMTWYAIEEDWDYAYVMVSVDGAPFVTAAGNITTETNPNGNNIGNGITGFSDDWVEGVFPLGEYAGHRVRIRFAYSTDQLVNEQGFYVDDISPVLGFGLSVQIAENLADTSLALDYGEIEEPLEYYYSVRSVDEQEQFSEWSNPLPVTIIPEGGNTVAETDRGLPERFAVAPLYPNPFNSTSTVRVALPHNADVTLAVYDLLGREVLNRRIRGMSAGEHALQLRANGWSSGLYFVRVTAIGSDGTKKTAVRKALLLR